MDNELNAEERRHLRAAILFYEAHGKKDLARKIEDATPDKQRFVINYHHGFLERGDAFVRAYWWISRIDRVFPVIRFCLWVGSFFAKKA
ncbi:MAG TPA: hypothetical protein VFF31_31730 [Blastocatellia bacterium]|jgi:hypothetical protein|nr:hypothetical protein [Blastocatellia bacterium]